MAFVLTEEQEAIRRTARDFVRAELPIARMRALRDGKDALGYAREAWRELARLGLVGLALPEAYGGAGLGYAELGLIQEELGRTLAPVPMLSTAVLGSSAIALGASEELRREILPAVCAGERLIALAHEEGLRHARYAIATRAESAPGGFVLSGEKSFVLDGHVADLLVVVARTSGATQDRDGLALFLVPARVAGVTVSRRSAIDSRNLAAVRLDEVRVPTSALLGGADLLDAVLDRATVALSAEMLGGLAEVFERTIDYLKVRRQFGVPIGSFQALKHRAAQMLCEAELSRSIVMEALRAIDEGRPEVPALACAAKARLSDAFLQIAAEGIQLHGGIGVTDEHDVGLFYKRARTAELTLGNAAYHRDRFGRLQGY